MENPVLTNTSQYIQNLIKLPYPKNKLRHNLTNHTYCNNKLQDLNITKSHCILHTAATCLKSSMLLLHQTIPHEAILYSIRQNTIFDSVFFKNQGVLDVTNLWIGGLEINNLPLKFWEKDKGKASLHYSKICSKYSFLSVVACENSFFSSPLVKDIVRGSMAWSQWEERVFTGWWWLAS